MKSNYFIVIALAVLTCLNAMAQNKLQIGCRSDSTDRLSIWHNSISDFVNGIATKKPIAGGGFVCVVAGTESLALIIMTLELSESKHPTDAKKTAIGEFIRVLKEKMQKFSCFAEKDQEAYQKVVAAMKLPKTTPAEKQIRDSAINKNNSEATEVPLKATQEILEILQIVKKSIPFIADVLISDVGAGVSILHSSSNGLLLFARNNAITFPPKTKSDFQQRINSLETATTKVVLEIQKNIKLRMKL